MSHRYFLQISYIGTYFRGLQKNLVTHNYDSRGSVQGAIELALTKLGPINEPKLILSSRTDTGVHALHSGVHVDLTTRSGFPYAATSVTLKLNKFFYTENLHIRVLKTEIVPDTFHARFSAKGRTYLYRLAVVKNEEPPEIKKVYPYVPIEECDRCFFLYDSKFDINLARQAADLLVGLHDFRTFMGASQQGSQRDHPTFTVRRIDSIKVEASHTTCSDFSSPWSHEHYNYWNIQISARSFLNRQVRRMVGLIIAIGQKRLTLRDAHEMLTIPSRHSWCQQAVPAPAYGLYLCRVDYNDKDKVFPETESQSTSNNTDPSENELPQRTEN